MQVSETGQTGDWNWSCAPHGLFTVGHEEGGVADHISGCAEERGPLLGRSARAGAT